MSNPNKPSELSELIALLRQRRDPDRGDPWDLAQDFQRIGAYTLEEAYEVVDAIERKAIQGLKEELADLLWQVIYHSQLADEQGAFDFEQVVSALLAKLRRRYQVPACSSAATLTEDASAWQRHKAQERQEKNTPDRSVLAELTLALPALRRAQLIQQRVSQVGFDWQAVRPALAKVREELSEVDSAISDPEHADHVQEELGDVLFSVVNVIRLAGGEAEGCLRAANAKFERRFRALEQRVEADGLSLSACDLSQLEAYWQAVKRQERQRRDPTAPS